jgi:hypothetical protein
MWGDGLELVQGVRTKDGTETDKAIISKMDFFVERGFSIRLVVVHQTVGTALIFVVGAPMCLDKLKTNVSEKNPLTPKVGVKASLTGNQQAAKALYISSGWGQFPPMVI